MKYLFDTNIFVNSIRNKEFKEYIQNTYFKNENSILMSIVSEAELKTIAFKNNWGKNKLYEMEMQLKEIINIPIKFTEIIKNYIEIDTFSQGKHPEKRSDFSARNMGKNDIWIAATAKSINATLVTSDLDFSHLEHHYLSLDTINFREITNRK